MQGLIPQCSKEYLSLSALNADSLKGSLVCTSVGMLKIPDTVSPTIVWTHENAAHTGRNGQRCSCDCWTYPGKVTPISRKGPMKHQLFFLKYEMHAYNLPTVWERGTAPGSWGPYRQTANSWTLSPQATLYNHQHTDATTGVHLFTVIYACPTAGNRMIIWNHSAFCFLTRVWKNLHQKCGGVKVGSS